MLRKIGKSLLMLLLMLAMFITDNNLVQAIDFNETGSITVTLQDDDGNLLGGSLMLYQVADIEEIDGKVSYRFTNDFVDCGIDLTDLNKNGLADHLLGYATAKQLEGTLKEADKNGTVLFKPLTSGLYLIVQKDTMEGYYPIAPFLVSIPMFDEVENDWSYHVTANPKIQPRPDVPVDKRLSVRKVWEGENPQHPNQIQVQLLCDGKVYDTVVLDDSNNWRYVWENLNSHYRWSVVELDVPENYTVDYSENGTSILITNKLKESTEEITNELTVIKVWEEDNGKDRPTEITVQLWNADVLYDTVVLNEQKDWTYTWTDLPEKGNWRVKEVNPPKNYLVSYGQNGCTYIIKNTYSDLIYTGQLNWPIPLLAGIGLILMSIGIGLIIEGRKREDA